MKLTIVLLVLFCALLGAAGQVFFKLASKDVTPNLLDWLKNYKFLLGASLYGISAILFVWSLKYGDLSILYPIIATSYIWVSIFSVFLLGEHFSFVNFLGVLSIIFGIALITR